MLKEGDLIIYDLIKDKEIAKNGSSRIEAWERI